MHVAYPVPLNTIVGAEEKQPTYPPLTILNPVTIVLPPFRVGVMFITPPPLYDIVGCDVNVPYGEYGNDNDVIKLPIIAVAAACPPP